ncbi:MAG: LLM class F420-dependent oxidoreductase [Acidobacteria bacterium]|nr:LLM class F420-dependent oxidoreductase [Acidobacteriota bacterium]
MKFGISFPYRLIGDDPELYRHFVQLAEELGFGYVTFIDHVLGVEHARRQPPLTVQYNEESVFHEPFTLMSWLAAHTERLELVTAVLVLAQRQAALVAKQAAEVHQLSGGRLRLGVGTGWNHVEYESLGVPFDGRGARFEEQIEILRKLWTEPVVDYAGTFHRIDRAGIRPLPGETVPVWLGGFSRAQLDRCARIGDGFIWEQVVIQSGEARPEWWQLNESNPLRRGVDFIRARAAEVGRSPDSIGHQLGTIDTGHDAARFVEPWSGIGGTHLTVAVRGEGPDLLDGLRHVGRDLGSLLHS